MNRSFEIVTDSCCNLTEETIDRYELHKLDNIPAQNIFCCNCALLCHRSNKAFAC